MKKYLIYFLILTANVFAGLDAFSGKVINVATPTADTDAANKLYVDELPTRTGTDTWGSGSDFTWTFATTGTDVTIDFTDTLISLTGNLDVSLLINSVELGSAVTDNYWFGDAQTMSAGANLSNSSNNIAIGSDALEGLTEGDDNIAIGTNSLVNLVNGISSSYANRNIAIGTDAGDGIQIGSRNIIIGVEAMSATSSDVAVDNIIIGDSSGVSITSGDGNVSLGNHSLASLVAGSRNVGIGHNSGQNATANGNTFIGYNSGNRVGGNFNVAVGEAAMLGAANPGGITSDAENIAIGYQAMGDFVSSNTENNIAIGTQALYSVGNDGDDNIAIGDTAGYALTTGDNNIAIGKDALDTATTATNNIAIGQNAMTALTTVGCTENVAIGTNAGAALISASHNNVLIGQNTGLLLTVSDGNVFIGELAGNSTAPSINDNVCIGTNAGQDVTSGTNVMIGDQAGQNSSGSGASVYIGSAAGSNNDGHNNIAIGNLSGQRALNQTSAGNISIGNSALLGTNSGTHAYNVALGEGTIQRITTGDYNVAVGFDAMGSATASITGDNNIAVGNSACLEISSGSNNIGIGKDAGIALTTGDNNIMLGYLAGKYETGSDSLYIDALDRTDEATAKTNSLIYGTFDADPNNQTLAVNAALSTPYTIDAIGTITGGTITDSTATLTGGNLTSMGNITGDDVDITTGTGDYLSASGDITLTDGNITLDDGHIVITDDTSPQLSLENDAANYATFGVDAGGDLTVDASGGFIRFSDLDLLDIGSIDELTVTGHMGLAGAAISDSTVLNADGGGLLTDNVHFSGGKFAPTAYKTAAAYTGQLAAVLGIAGLGASNTQNWTDTKGLIGVRGRVTTVTGSTGTLTGAACFESKIGIFGNQAITNVYGHYFETGADTGNKVVNEYGIYMENQNLGSSSNYAIYTNDGLVRFGDSVIMAAAPVYTPSSTQSYDAADTIIVTNGTMVVQGNGAAVTLTSVPTISTTSISDGTVVIFFGNSDTNTLTLQDNDVLSNTDLELKNSANAILGEFDFVAVQYIAAKDKWCELYRSDN